MKRLIFVIVLILLNFIMFNYLANHFKSKFTYDKMIMTFIVSFIAISIMCLIISFFKYILKLCAEQSHPSFRTMYVNLYLDASITIYILLMLVTLITFI